LSLNRGIIQLKFLQAKIPLAKIRICTYGGFYVYPLDKPRYWILTEKDLDRVIAELKRKEGEG